MPNNQSNSAQVEIPAPVEQAPMSAEERIAALEARLAQSEAQIAILEPLAAKGAEKPAKAAFEPTLACVTHPVGYKATPQSWASAHVYVEAQVTLTRDGKPRKISERKETWLAIFAAQEKILAAFDAQDA